MPMQRLKVRKALTLRESGGTRVRAKVSGTPLRPRLNVFRSGKHIYAQVIDDVRSTRWSRRVRRNRRVRALAGTGDGMTKTERAKLVGRMIADQSAGGGDHAGRLRPRRISLSWPRPGARGRRS